MRGMKIDGSTHTTFRVVAPGAVTGALYGVVVSVPKNSALDWTERGRIRAEVLTRASDYAEASQFRESLLTESATATVEQLINDPDILLTQGIEPLGNPVTWGAPSKPEGLDVG